MPVAEFKNSVAGFLLPGAARMKGISEKLASVYLPYRSPCSRPERGAGFIARQATHPNQNPPILCL